VTSLQLLFYLRIRSAALAGANSATCSNVTARKYDFVSMDRFTELTLGARSHNVPICVPKRRFD